ncbi:DUF2634 domain-containing protein [Paenibacillus senegalensis]|uniref:DUF2634 domain-containing protein n=1 Tax=Paenibacillus senegalensis TaxID=1465766 RepID=UPI000288C197|nr:DUF2634 domain-containing protein [Paenibacillus senegalensis]
MIPQGARLGEIENTRPRQKPSRTYRILPDQRRISGKVDGLEAVKQAVAKILRTERYEYLIYSFNYGSELKSLIGGDRLYVQSEMARRIKEALLQDDRIENVTDFDWSFSLDGITVQCTVQSSYGTFEVSQEVGQDV